MLTYFKKNTVYSVLLLATLGICTTGYSAQECEKISVQIVNKSKYDWYLDRTQSYPPLDTTPPSVIKAGTTANFSQNSTDYWQSLTGGDYSDLFGSPYEQTLVYYVKTADSDGSRPYYFQIYLSYAVCQWPEVCTDDSKSNPGQVDASANIDVDSANVLSVANSDDDGNTGNCAEWEKTAGVWYPTGSFTKQDDGDADFTIEQPTAVGLHIELPFEDAPTIKNQSFLQQTFNNLDPSITSHFDYTLSNPLDEATNSFNFNLPCTSDACQNI